MQVIEDEEGGGGGTMICAVQGYLALKKQPPPYELVGAL
jgi:hypothetical protein